MSLPAAAQSASDLLQKGIHAQETSGDLDGAIAIFRQVVDSPSTIRPLAAQAQYQLVLCMLQKGDLAAASRELSALERNFADMPDLVAKARKLIPSVSTLLPAPWGDRECAQLDIKRAGVSTGEYLYYSADAWTHWATDDQIRNATMFRDSWGGAILHSTYFRWELKTTNSTRGIMVRGDNDTRRPFESPAFGDGIEIRSDDELGDPLVIPFTGPATDFEQSVFLMRRLPLAVGYKTALPVTSNSYAPSQLELTVTGIESVVTPAGKFNCYKVSFAAIGQTFWIGVEGARPLVKFQSGSVEADLVKVWGPENPLLDALTALTKAAGGRLANRGVGPGKSTTMNVSLPHTFSLDVVSRNIHTPPAEIPQALQRLLAAKTAERHAKPQLDYVVRPGSLQTRLIGGQQALSCLLDNTQSSTDNQWFQTLFIVWIVTENTTVELSMDMPRQSVGAFRWSYDPFIDALRIP